MHAGAFEGAPQLAGKLFSLKCLLDVEGHGGDHDDERSEFEKNKNGNQALMSLQAGQIFMYRQRSV